MVRSKTQVVSQCSSFSHVCPTGPLHQLHICCYQRRKSTTGKGKKGVHKFTPCCWSTELMAVASFQFPRSNQGGKEKPASAQQIERVQAKRSADDLYNSSLQPGIIVKPAPNNFNFCSLVCHPCFLSTTSSRNNSCSFFPWSVNPFWRWYIFKLKQ